MTTLTIWLNKLNMPQIDPSNGVVITNFWSIALDDHWSKKIYRPKMIVDVLCSSQMILFLFWGVSLHVCSGWDPSMWQLFVERFWVICVCLHHLVVLGLLLLQWIQWGPNLVHEEINSLTTPSCNQRHPVEVNTAQWKSTTTNWNLSKPYNFKTFASRTKKNNQ